MDDLTSKLLSGFLSKGQSDVDVGSYIKGEVEEAISPVTSRVDRLEKKIDILILTAEKIEKLLISFQPVIKIINKLPFLK